MKSPITNGEAVLEQRQSVTEYKGKRIWYTRRYYRCLDTNTIFSDSEIDGKNLEEIYAKYDKMNYDNNMDDYCSELCDAINNLNGLRTTESCNGHLKNVFKIFLNITDLKSLSILVRALDTRYSGTFITWSVELVTSDKEDKSCPRFSVYIHSNKPYENYSDMKKDVDIIIQNIEYWNSPNFNDYFTFKI